jgi:hypothetical protein
LLTQTVSDKIIIHHVAKTMSLISIDLDWLKDSAGYQIVDYGKHGARIVGNGGDLVPFRPLDGNELVFIAFAKVRSRTALLDFVGHYGLLKNPAYGVRYSIGSSSRRHSATAGVRFDPDTGQFSSVKSVPAMLGEDVDSHLETAALFQRAMNVGTGALRRSLLRAKIEDALGEIDSALGELSLVVDRQRGFRPVLRATSLLGGIWLQLSQRLSGNSRFKSCKLCGQMFEVGIAGGRRLDAIFCSDKHRVDFNSLSRSKRS